MSKNYKFLSEEDLNKPSDVVETDWRLCVLCQEDTSEKLINPGGVFFFRGTHKVRDDLQISHFVG